MKFVGILAKWFGIALYAAIAVVIVLFLMPLGGWKALNVLTGSMEPTISPGDLVFIHRVRFSDIKPGDIVTYANPANPNQTITHRVVSKPMKNGIQMVITKGDSNASPDLAFPSGRIVGRQYFTVPAAGRVLDFLHSPYVLAAVVIIPGLLVIWAELRILRRELFTPTKPANPPSSSPPPPPTPPEPRPSRSHRPLDSLGPRTLHVSLLLGLAVLCATGSTYARATTKASISHVTFTVTAPSTAAQVAIAAFNAAYRTAMAQFRTDTNACLAGNRPISTSANIARNTATYNAGVTAAEDTLLAQVTNPATLYQGSAVHANSSTTATTRAANSLAASQVQLTMSLDTGPTIHPAATTLNQCLTAAHNKFLAAVRHALDELEAALRRIFHR